VTERRFFAAVIAGTLVLAVAVLQAAAPAVNAWAWHAAVSGVRCAAGAGWGALRWYAHWGNSHKAIVWACGIVLGPVAAAAAAVLAVRAVRRELRLRAERRNAARERREHLARMRHLLDAPESVIRNALMTRRDGFYLDARRPRGPGPSDGTDQEDAGPGRPVDSVRWLLFLAVAFPMAVRPKTAGAPTTSSADQEDTSWPSSRPDQPEPS
jgi:signal transduction histidine kinase